MPKRIVITCWGSHGDLFPYIGLALALKARGHAAVVATSPGYRDEVERAGLEFAVTGPSADPTDLSLYERVMDPIRGGEVIVRELLLPVLRETYAELERAAVGADLLVSHPIAFATPLFGERTGVPWISTVLAPMLFFSATDVPVFPQAPWLVHLRRLGPWVSRRLIALASKATSAWMEPVYRLRAELGLPQRGNPFFEGQFSPTMTLAMFSRVLAAPQPDWPPNVATTGCVFYNGPDGLSPELEDFLSAGEPPLVFTLGTSAVGAAGRFYHESAAAAARLGVRAVLLAGSFAQNRPDSLPPGVLLVDRAPHQLLFPRARAIVHQGGAGTLGQALRSGKPMIVVPHGHDQHDNAFRVTNLGVARTIYPQHYRAPRVERELARLLSDARYREHAAATATIVAQEGGAAAAADAIEGLLADGSATNAAAASA